MRAIASSSALLWFVAASALHAQTMRTIAGPAIRIEAESPGAPLVGRFRHAALLPNGGVIVADDAEHAIRWLDSSGRHVRSLGREGSGPGEFRAVEWAGVCGADSVMAFDRMQSRVAVYSPAGKYVRQQTVGGVVAVLGCLSDGSLVGIAPKGGSGSDIRGSVMLLGPDAATRSIAGNILLRSQRPLGAELHVTARDLLIAFGSSDSAIVQLLDVKATTERRVVAGVIGRTPSEAHVNEAIETLATNVRGTEAEYEMMRGLLRRMPAAPTLPAFSALVLDAARGTLWVVRTARGNRETVLEGQPLDGSPKQLVRIARDLIVFDVRDGRLLALEVDPQSGSEALVIFELPR